MRTGTSLQHKMKSYIHYMVLARILDIHARKPEVKPSKPAWKAGVTNGSVNVMGEVPREALDVSLVAYFNTTGRSGVAV